MLVVSPLAAGGVALKLSAPFPEGECWCVSVESPEKTIVNGDPFGAVSEKPFRSSMPFSMTSSPPVDGVLTVTLAVNFRSPQTIVVAAAPPMVWGPLHWLNELSAGSLGLLGSQE